MTHNPSYLGCKVLSLFNQSSQQQLLCASCNRTTGGLHANPQLLRQLVHLLLIHI